MIKPLKKVKSFDGLADVGSGQTDALRVAALFTVASDGTIEKDIAGMFLLNPTSWDESKSVNWVAHQTPGQSDPILQWLSSGPRTVSFSALVTAETSDFVQIGEKPGEPKKNSGFLDKIFSGSIASKFARISDPPAPRQIPLDEEKTAKTLDISYYLDYYRSLAYPVYDDIDTPRRLRNSPPLLVLFAGSAISKLEHGTRISDQNDLWVLTNLRIKITKQLPNLAPQEAEVEFQLTQYTIRSRDRRYFQRL